MSFTRLDYDKCAYSKTLEESCSPLEYMMYQGKFEHSKQCPVGDHTNNLEFGIKTDVESDLRGQTRQASKCPTEKFPKNKAKVPDFSPARMCEHVHYLTPSGLTKPIGDGLKDGYKLECGAN